MGSRCTGQRTRELHAPAAGRHAGRTAARRRHASGHGAAASAASAVHGRQRTRCRLHPPSNPRSSQESPARGRRTRARREQLLPSIGGATSAGRQYRWQARPSMRSPARGATAWERANGGRGGSRLPVPRPKPGREARRGGDAKGAAQPHGVKSPRACAAMRQVRPGGGGRILRRHGMRQEAAPFGQPPSRRDGGARAGRPPRLLLWARRRRGPCRFRQEGSGACADRPPCAACFARRASRRSTW